MSDFPRDVFDELDFKIATEYPRLERPMYFDRQGKPITLGGWARLIEQDPNGYRIIARDELRGNVMVSTVWLGIDHSFGYGPPLIFETMIFGGHLDGTMDRYATEAQALQGHRILADRAGQAPWLAAVGCTFDYDGRAA